MNSQSSRTRNKNAPIQKPICHSIRIVIAFFRQLLPIVSGLLARPKHFLASNTQVPTLLAQIGRCRGKG